MCRSFSSCCCDKIFGQNNLRKRGFILVHSSRGHTVHCGREGMQRGDGLTYCISTHFTYWKLKENGKCPQTLKAHPSVTPHPPRLHFIKSHDLPNSATTGDHRSSNTRFCGRHFMFKPQHQGYRLMPVILTQGIKARSWRIPDQLG